MRAKRKNLPGSKIKEKKRLVGQLSIADNVLSASKSLRRVPKSRRKSYAGSKRHTKSGQPTG
jgi:hypothetical protein